ncbi:MAG: tetratricopeptide repeat protein [Alphaproteobacteria bacterium]|nr:tetratricopeptide repeat protein [Alphaproteobacteria bacterium]
MALVDRCGVALTGDCSTLVDRLQAAHDELLHYRGDPVGMVDEILAERPDFVMGWVFKAAVLTQAMETRIYDDMVHALQRAEALWDKANERERGHILAIRKWVDGDFYGAVEQWDAVLVDHPRDLLALQLAHLSDVLLGDTLNQRDRVARVLHAWDESAPGYNFVLGFHSFGLEECGDYARAEEAGRRAVAMDPQDSYAIHAVAHVLEMMGRQGGGVWWLGSRTADWAHSNFANHLWWHKSLYHLDLCQYDAVFEIFDNHLQSDAKSGDKYEELDAAALLWRLNLYGVDVQGRWDRLADKWEHAAEDTLYAFNDVHAMMTFVSDNRLDLAQRVLDANERYVRSEDEANVAMTREVGLPFCHAIAAFAAKDYEKAVDLLHPIRHRTAKLGGSHAQRDVIHLTLIEAALRCGRYKLARALVSERTELKPTSPQNWLMQARALRGAGDAARAEAAQAQAVALQTLRLAEQAVA